MSNTQPASKMIVRYAIIGVTSVLFITVVGMIVLALLSSSSAVDDTPGSVIGPNPNNIPESKLPRCNFTGAEMLEKPCYSPPDAIYL